MEIWRLNRALSISYPWDWDSEGTKETYLGPQMDSMTGTSDTSPTHGAETAVLATAGRIATIQIVEGWIEQ